MHKTLNEYPNLVTLTPQQVATVLKKANMTPCVAAKWVGCSRVAMGRWLGETPGRLNYASLEAVSTLAYRVLRALKHDYYPIPYQRARLKDPFAALRDESYDRPLSSYALNELLPSNWLEQPTPREQDATV